MVPDGAGVEAARTATVTSDTTVIDPVVDPRGPEPPAGRPAAWRHVAAWRPPGRDVLAFGVFGVLTLLLFRGAWRSPTTRWIGGGGDPPLFMWFLRWMPHALANGENPLFSHHINVPDGVNLMWNTAVPLPALLLSPVTVFISPVLAYNLLVTSAVVLSGFFTYLMLRRYVRSRAAAFAGGLLYGFSPFVYAQAHEHPNLALAFVPPLMFLLLDEILVRQRRSATATGLALGGLAFVQFAMSEELLATQVLVAGLGLGVLLIFHPGEVRARARHAATALGLGAVVSLALAAVPLAFQFFGPRRVRTGAIWDPESINSDLLAFVIPTNHLQFSPAWTNEITRHFTDACCGSEWSTYLGVPLIGLMIVVTTRMWSRPLVRMAGMLAGIVIVLALGPHLHVRGYVTPMTLPFAKIAELPLVGNMFSERLMVYVYLMAAILVAVALDRLLAQPRRRAGLALVVAVFALLPVVPDVDFPSTEDTTPAFFRTDAVDRIPDDSVMLVAPFARDTSTSGPMLWQAHADMRYRMPAGYALGPDRTGRFTYLPIPTPLSTTMEEIQRGAPAPVLDPENRALYANDLARARVQSVAVGEMQNRQVMIEFFRDLLGREPMRTKGVTYWTDVDPSRLR